MSGKLQTESSDDSILPRKILDEIERICKERRLSSDQREKLVETVKKEYLNSSFEPGEAIGIISAQSISEPATQMTMRTFHFAGSAGIQITLGLPRLIEIFDAKKEPTTSTMTLYLKKKFNNKTDCERIADEMTEKKLRNYVHAVSLDLTNSRIKVRFKTMKKNELEDIISRLRKKVKNYKIVSKKSIMVVGSKEKKLAIKDLQKIKKKLLDLPVSGIQGIKDVIVTKDGNDWVIKTSGSNFKKIQDIEEIDFLRSYTNNIHELVNVLGIEAARNALIKEIKNTMKQQGLDVDDRHIMLVADMMTFSGEVKPIGRYGVAGMKQSVLTRAGFEETIKHLVRASVRQEEDNFNAIFDNVMVNQVVPVGTGMFDLIAKLGEE
ncbi:MAG: DNA-directed RNA polymerase subunit A'' [Candidatus Aenigmarchaeota archaeon]|nr:DNA-directed RNA polymerase subunit A'' [Candidatus Aenigmarchaeota archaeon]